MMITLEQRKKTIQVDPERGRIMLSASYNCRQQGYISTKCPSTVILQAGAA